MDYIAETLEWVNREREAHGYGRTPGIPKGLRGSACECPVARALRPLDAEVGPDTVAYLNGDGGEIETFDTPEPVKHFLRAFDRGDLEHYVEAYR